MKFLDKEYDNNFFNLKYLGNGKHSLNIRIKSTKKIIRIGIFKDIDELFYAAFYLKKVIFNLKDSYSIKLEEKKKKEIEDKINKKIEILKFKLIAGRY